MKKHALVAFSLFVSQLASAAVNLPSTPIRSQNGVGFCWSYGAVAYLEQQLRLKKRGHVDLSEEYIGFYNMAEQMAAGVEQVFEGGQGILALDWVEKYGIVPESVFNYKVYVPGLEEKVNAGAQAYWADRKLPKGSPIPLEDSLAIIEKAAGSKRVPRADETFSYRGKTYTPKSFARERVGFKRSEVFALELVSPAKQPALYEQQMQLLKKSLIYGYSVPMNFKMFDLKTTAEGIWDCEGCDSLEKKDAMGGHVVLMTDFRAEGSRFGRLSLEELKAAVTKPVNAWAFKNSWSYRIDTNVSPLTEGLTSIRGLPTWGAITDRYYRASNRLEQDCAGCDMTFKEFYKSSTFSEADSSQGLAVIPAEFVTPRRDAEGNPILGGLPAAFDTTIDWSRAVIAPETAKAEYKGAAPRPAADAQVLEAVRFDQETFGNLIHDTLDGNVTVKQGEAYATGFQFTANSPWVKSVGIFMGKKDEKGNVTYTRFPNRAMTRENGVFSRVAPNPPVEIGKPYELTYKAQGLDTNGEPVGAPLTRTLTVTAQ